MIKVSKHENSIFEGKEVTLSCMSCSKEATTTDIVVTDKYNQEFRLHLCDGCKAELTEKLCAI